jgi:hypothetical protein
MPLLCLAVDRQAGTLSLLEVCMFDCSFSGVCFSFPLMKEVFMYFLVAITSWKYKGYASDD